MSESPRPLSAAELSNLSSLADRARAADGTPPFSDGSLVALAEGTRELRWLDGSAVAIVAVGLSPAEAEFVVDPDARRHGLGTRLLDQLLAEHEELLVWAHGNSPGARALAAARGLVASRELLQLRAPVQGGSVSAPAGFELAAATEGYGGAEGERHERGGRGPGGWRQPWLELNARAFAEHPEQGGMTPADLDQLTREPWFHLDDVLLLWHGDTLAGSCWLKIAEGEPGEFYAVAVAPEHQGAGLGRALMAAGMAKLSERGIREATLYVEADNTPALRLYRGFGFREHSIDVQYRYAKVMS